MSDSQSNDRADTRKLMEARVRALCREYSGARLAGALLELAREVTHSPSGFLASVSTHEKLRINALTPDLEAGDLSGSQDSPLIDLESLGESWSSALLGSARVMVNTSHRLLPMDLVVCSSLVVPIVFAGDMVGLLYVANKSADYDDSDAWSLERIAHWSALEVRDFVDAQLEAPLVTIADEPTMPTGEAADWLGNKFQLLFELAPIGMVLSELEGRFLLPNHAFLDLIGYTREQATSLTELDLSPPSSALFDQRRIIQALIERGRFGPLERQYIRQDGAVVDVLLHGLVIKAVDDTPYRWTFVQDITESNNIAAALQKSKQAAEAAARAKADFVATVSHELRTPINGVVGLSSLLMDTGLSEQQREYVTSLARSGRALLDLVNDVLDFAKLEGGRILLELHPFDLHAIVEQVVDLISEPAAAKGLRVVLSCEPSLQRRVIGDAGRVRQILLELLSNAVKFTERGRIGVTVATTSETDSDLIVAFEIADTGIGIASDAQQRIFDSFTQADNSSTRRFGGTGLGLAISKRLVDLMGGQIGLVSDLGAGSTFRFTVRFKRVSEESEDAPLPPTRPRRRAATEPSGKRGRVLVAEDNPVNQLVLVRMLERLGYQADAVGNGLEAIAAMRQAHYDLVLMDCHMPEMDGFEATRRIRDGMTDMRQVVIVAVTAGANEDRCYDVGMNDYLTKPLDPELLGATIERWLQL